MFFALTQSGVHYLRRALVAAMGCAWSFVALGEGESVPFTLVADDLVYPVPAPSVADNYIFYVGFDPQALSPEPKARPKKK